MKARELKQLHLILHFCSALGSSSMASRAQQVKALPPPSRRLALVLCLIPACYLGLYGLYGLAHFADYGSDLPRFLRYAAAPLVLSALFIASGALLPTVRSSCIGLVACASLLGLFAYEAVMSARLLLVIAGMFGTQIPGKEDPVNGSAGLPPAFTTKRMNDELGITRLDQAVLGGLPSRNVVMCVSNGKPVFYKADRFGFNNPDELYEAPVDTIVIGDSFVEGHCLDRDQSMVGRLRARRPHSIGLGMRGSGPLFELALLGRFALPLRPRTIVFAFFEGNDWENLRAEMTQSWLRPALTPNADFGSTDLPPVMIDRMTAVIDRWRRLRPSLWGVIWRNNFARNFVALNHSARLLGLAYPKVARDEPGFVSILARAKSLASQSGARLILVYIPQVDRYEGFIDQQFVYDRLRERVLRGAAQTGIETIDLAEEFDRHSNPAELFAPDAHLSEAGADLAAELINKGISLPPRNALTIARGTHSGAQSIAKLLR